MEGAHRMSATAWTVQLSVTTTRRVEDATVASLLSGVPACRDTPAGHGVPGISVLLGVEATTAAGAYGAALLVLVTEVLPRLDGPLLTDALIRTGTRPMAQQEPLGMGLPGSGRGTSALA